MGTARGADEAADRRVLTKNTMQMKFMQKGKIKIVDEVEEMSRRIKRSKEHWVLRGLADQPKKLPYQFNTSIVKCENLIPIGRMAFLNFNPPVERTYKEILGISTGKISSDREDYDQISDEEMAARYDSLIHTIDNKFQKKRKRGDNRRDDDQSDSDSESDEEIREMKKRAKRGFLKPKIED